MFVEFVKDSKQYRHNIVPLSDIDPHKGRPYEAYISICPYDREILSHMQATKSKEYPRGNVAGYTGQVFCRWIHWDFDGGLEQIKTAQDDAKSLVNYLIGKYGVPGNDVGIYFSGGKGFHVGIAASHIGGVDPMPGEKMASLLSAFTERIIDDTPGLMSSFDNGLYAVNRYFRLPNSRHASTGRYKIPLKVEELMEMEPLEILELAEMPRTNFSFDFSRKVMPKHQLQKVWDMVQAGTMITAKARAALESLPEDEAELFKLAVKFTQQTYSVKDYHNRNRNNYTFLLSAWCNDLGIGAAGDGARALELITAHRQNDLGDDPGTWDMTRVEQTVNNAYKRLRRNFGEKRTFLKKTAAPSGSYQALFNLEEEVLTLSRSLRPKMLLRVSLALNAATPDPLPEEEVQELVLRHVRHRNALGIDSMPKPIYYFGDAFVDKSIRTANSKGLGIQCIDQAENYDYEGKVVQIIGMGGVGKSIFLKDICMHSSINGERVVYSTMEDTALRLFERVIRSGFEPTYELDPDTGEVVNYKTAIARLAELARNEEKTVREALSRYLRKLYGDFFLIDERVAMGKAEYEETIKYLLNKYGKLDKLCIDGLSTMAGTGRGEVDAAIRNSFDVKELANEYKLLVPVLVHVPGGIDKETRNLWDYTRGGPKIMQNGDLFISLSFIQDEAASSPGDIHYFKDKIFMKYWGKRTSGQILERILQLDTQALTWKETDLTLEDVGGEDLV